MIKNYLELFLGVYSCILIILKGLYRPQFCEGFVSIMLNFG